METKLPYLLLMLLMRHSWSLETMVLMQVHEDDFRVQDHWEAVLHCAVTHHVRQETCSKIWWSHESDRHLTPPHDDPTYRVTSELNNNKSHLKILSFSDTVKGIYTCKAKCGNSTYGIRCLIEGVPHKNRSSLCSEKKFSANNIAASTADSDEESHTGVYFVTAIGAIVSCAVVITGLLRWLHKRHQTQKHYRQIVQNMSRLPSQAASTPGHERRDFPVRNVVLPPMPQSIFGHMPSQVLYQHLSDGSQIVFIPASKLPSYEESLSLQTGPSPSPGGVASVFETSTSRVHPKCESSETSRGRMSGSEASAASLPPSYTSTFEGLRDQETNSDLDISSDQDEENQEPDQPTSAPIGVHMTHSPLLQPLHMRT
ncbi:uncharacterized protein LOC124272049 [Haliotis rubra]|uniref:uncharacterized protein LOC124272049 n=1 Tax=Haliotis rubra TaxID=36100 RepID=UPI001EE52A16|nr:uncharacterized protein LOC124272049 [Haliotis rubra]